jgi:hypothetical protein
MNYKPEPLGKPQIVDIKLGPQLSVNPLVLWVNIYPEDMSTIHLYLLASK